MPAERTTMRQVRAAAARHDLLEILEERYGRHSTISRSTNGMN